MLFVEPFFLFLVLPLSVIAFYGTAHFLGGRAALAPLIIVSVIFYAPYGLTAATILLLSLSFNIICGMLLVVSARYTENLRKVIFVTGLIFNIFLLFIFKYLDNILSVTSITNVPWLGLSIPAGISFYTFHQSVFLLDAYNRQHEVVTFLANSRSVAGKVGATIRYVVFVAFFPQLVIGPITYLREFAPQIFRRDFGHIRLVDCQIGVTLIVIGLFKKLWIADALAVVVDPIYATVFVNTEISRSQACFAITGYYFQLYFDFSGYSDIALGIARLFGIRLPINFDSPLRATGIVDFYRRWHITLTRVIALFLFTPLCLWGTRLAMKVGYKGWRLRALSSWLPLLANFQVIAIWHAAKVTFMTFGLIHGAWYIFETEIRTSRAFKKYRQHTSDSLRVVLGIMVTTIPLMLTFALFRSENMEGFMRLVTALIFSDAKAAPAAPIKLVNWQALGFAAATAYFLPNTYVLMRRYRPGIFTFANVSTAPPLLVFTWRPTLIWGCFIAVLLALVFTKLNLPAPFLYAGF